MIFEENALKRDGLHKEERELFQDWWDRLCRGYPDIPVPVLAAGLGRIFCNRMRVERDDKPDEPGGTIFFFAEPYWESLDHIVRWLQRAVRESAVWLMDVDDHGRPKRLLSASSFTDLEREADRDTDAECEKLAKTLGKHDEITVENIDGGYRVVRLLAREAVEVEAMRMHHHVGQVEDWDRFESGEKAYYSLRAPDGFPVATMTVEHPTTEQGILIHIAGHRNSSVSDEHLAMLLPWLRRQGWDGVDFHCGLVEPEHVNIVWQPKGP